MKYTLYSTAILILTFFSSCVATSNEKSDVSNPPIDYPKKGMSIDGEWEVTFISNSELSAEQIAEKPPVFMISSVNHTISGNTSCNNFSATCDISDETIHINKVLSTKKMCLPETNVENIFLSTLQKINTYSISDNGQTITFIMGDIAVMNAKRK